MNMSLLSTDFEQVGRIVDLTEVEVTAVIYLRMWHCGSEGKAKIHNNFSLGVGPGAAHDLSAAFEHLCFFAVTHGLQPFRPSALNCPLVNPGEAEFANLIANAAYDQDDLARQTATALVGEDGADNISDSARICGKAFLATARKAQNNWQACCHPSQRPH